MMLAAPPATSPQAGPARRRDRDFEVAEEMIKHFIRKVHGRRSFARR